MRKTLIAACAVGFTALAFATPASSFPSTPTIEHGQTNAGVIDVGYRDRLRNRGYRPYYRPYGYRPYAYYGGYGYPYYRRPGISLGFAW
jgi:hypothetical protein